MLSDVDNNTESQKSVLNKTNIVYKFAGPLGDCISNNNNNKKVLIYISHTTTALSLRLNLPSIW